MPENRSRVGVALCAELTERCGLDLEALRERLEADDSDICVTIVSDLCHRPGQLPEIAASAASGRVVLALCDREFAAHEFQRWARRGGLDPFAVELVSLEGLGGADGLERAALRLAAASARARAFGGSRPEQLRPRFLPQSTHVSRKSLFTLPPINYEALPSISPERCLGASRCGLCATACPAEAIKVLDGHRTVDRDACVACGICTTTCPVGAIEQPGSTLAQYEAELATILSAGETCVAFTCRDAAATLEAARSQAPGAHRWVPVELPCLGMVTAGWMLQALAHGAQAVAMVSCGDRCRSGRRADVLERIDYVVDVLTRLGLDQPTGRARMLPSETDPLIRSLADVPHGTANGDRPSEPLVLAEPEASAGALVALAHSGLPDGLGVHSHPGSALGSVAHRPDTCTLCGTCATVCPAGALSLERDDQGVELFYDTARCVGCGMCAAACPEASAKTLVAGRATDFPGLAAGRIALKRGCVEHCVRCGNPVAPTAMLEHVSELLENEGESPELLASLRELCMDCRGR